MRLFGRRQEASRSWKNDSKVRAVGSWPRHEWQIGYRRKLPAEYTSERHVVTVGRGADGMYGWEERRGAPPANEDGPTSIIGLFLVRAKDGRLDFPGRRMRTHDNR